MTDDLTGAPVAPGAGDARRAPASVWPSRTTPTFVAAVAVAWVAAVAQASTELVARRVAISAIPALIALGLDLVLVIALLLALLVRHRADRRAAPPTWPVAVALVAATTVVAARVALSPAEPTVAPLVPILLLPPLALTIELVVLQRRGTRPSPSGVQHLAAAWCAVAAVTVFVAAVGPSRWADVALRPTAVVAAGASLAAMALLGAVAALFERRRDAALRFGVVATVGAAVAAAADAPSGPGTVPTLAAAVAVPVVLLVPSAVVHAAVDTVSSGGRRLAHGGARSTRSAVMLLRRAGRRVRGWWWGATSFAAEGPQRARPSLTRTDRVGAAVMAVGAAGYVVNGLVWARRAGWQPTGHSASIMARAYDVGTVNHPWAGMATSLGSKGTASHPGPAVLDLLAPLVRLFGVQNGAQIGASLIVLVCWALAVWAAWRASGRLAAIGAWAASALVLEVAALGAPWEANTISVTMLAMFATVLASWAAGSGTWKAWWWAVGLGSVCAQSYIPHGLIVIGPVLWSGLALAGAARLGSAGARRSLRGGLVITAVVWAQPVLDAVLHRGGNIADLLTEVANPRPPVGIAGSWMAIGWIFAIPPRWSELTESFAQAGTAQDFLGTPSLTGIAVAGALVYLWWRTRSTQSGSERQLRVVTLLVVIGAALNTTQLPQDYLRSFQLGWLVVASICGWFTVVLSVCLAAWRRANADVPREWVPRLRVGALCVGALAVAVSAAARPDQIADMKGRPFTIDAMIGPAVDQTMESLDDRGPYLVLAMDSRLNEVATDTIHSNLIVRGVDTRSEALGAHYGERRVVDRWSGKMLWVTNDLGPVPPEGRRLASSSMPGWSRAEFDRAADEVAAITREAPDPQLQTWALPELPRYLAGWYGDDTCTVADELRRGDRSLAELPPGLLLTLYGDLAIASPQLSRARQEEASALLGQAPIEVWSVERRTEATSASAVVRRDGTVCPSVSEG